jgi:hypothetical protein
MTDTDKLAALAETISKHAAEIAGKEWLEIHKPGLLEILGGDREEMIQIGDRQIPSKH